jgi:hypothetical protein
MPRKETRYPLLVNVYFKGSRYLIYELPQTGLPYPTFVQLRKKKNTANYTDRATASCRRN